MLNKRYQVFVSSTFEDLVPERRVVLDSILRSGHFPSGMEYFPASGALPWEIIKKMIDDCDYYVVVIAARYGSIGEGDKSYTENEYDYAKSLGKYVIPFLHSHPEEVPAKFAETSPARKRQLAEFRKKIENSSTAKYWKTPDDLRSEVILSLSYAFANHPATGWVRADQADATEFLKKLVNLQEQYDELRKEKDALKNQLANMSDSAEEKLAFGSELVTLEVKENETVVQVTVTWNSVFIAMASFMITRVKEWGVRERLVSKNHGHASSTPNSHRSLTDSSFRMIRDQFLALELIEVFEETSTAIEPGPMQKLRHWYGNDSVTYWKLSQKGVTRYARTVAIMKRNESEESEDRKQMIELAEASDGQGDYRIRAL